ncbi:MAG: alanyl-tRNA editing protein [Thermoprotei archaeon]|nr:alanyl-tRNA editing protein [TACK group archaeon]
MPYDNLIYLHDSYVKEFKAKVIETGENYVVLDRTAFYPTGGGQPHDTGFITLDGERLEVVDVQKGGSDENPKVSHFVQGGPLPQVGAEVTGILNWERRYRLMRFHTAIHLIDAVIIRDHKEGFLTGSNIYEDRARFDLDWPTLRREDLPALEQEVNEEVKKNREVRVKFLTKEEAATTPDLARTRPGEELLSQLNYVRVVEIVGLDQQMDGGTHVKSTGEIGKISFEKFENKGKHNKRIEITLSPSSGF